MFWTRFTVWYGPSGGTMMLPIPTVVEPPYVNPWGVSDNRARVCGDDPELSLVIWAVTVIVLPQVGSVGLTTSVVPTRSAGVAGSIKTASVSYGGPRSSSLW